MKKFNLIFSVLIILILSAGCLKMMTASESGVVGNCGKSLDYLPINKIQGAWHRSPYDGKEVHCVEGIVTAIDGGGFFMQAPRGDEDPNTSEGVYVDLLAFASVRKGDLVVVEEGTIREYNPAGLGENSLTTTSLRTSKVTVVRSNQPLPSPIILGEGGRKIPDLVIENDGNGNVGISKAVLDPDEDGMDFFESLEAMRVQVNDALAISSVNGYNELFVLADGGRNATGLSQNGVLLLSESDANPERLMVDDAFVSMPDIRIGDVFTAPIVGILGYDFGNYRIMATDKLVFESKNKIDGFTRTELPELTKNQIAIASLNVLNLSHVEDPERLAATAKLISDKLKSPDILILQEIMDDDGRLNSANTSAVENLGALTEAIRAGGGADYQWFNIDPLRNKDGGVDGGNIRVVILFRLDRGIEILSAPIGSADSENEVIQSHGEVVLTQNPGRIWPNNPAFNESRKPIIAQFRFMDQSFFVIGVHFNSKGPDGPYYGDEQPPARDSERQRIAQAKAVNGFVKDILELDPNAAILVAGDMNDFPWSDAILTAQGNQLENLFNSENRGDWFTYIHEGNAQVMDQMLVSKAMRDRLTYFYPLHLNSVLPGKQQNSDHDPILGIFDFGIYE